MPFIMYKIHEALLRMLPKHVLPLQQEKQNKGKKMKTKYFRHKIGTSEDYRFEHLISLFGWEGYGIYFALIDQIKLNKNRIYLNEKFDKLVKKFRVSADKMDGLIKYLVWRSLLKLENNKLTLPVKRKPKKTIQPKEADKTKATAKPTKCPITNKKCPLLENGGPIAKTDQNQETLPLTKYSITELFDKFLKLHKNLQNQIIKANSKKYHILPDNTVTIRPPPW